MKRKTFTKIINILLLVVCCNIFPKNVKAQTYCSPTFVNGCDVFFVYANNTIQLNTINWSISNCAVSNYTGTSTTLTAGVGYPMTVTTTGYTGCSVWVDWNNDGNLNDPGDNVYNSYGGGVNNTYTFTLTPPCATPTGSYRMRVIAGWGTSGYDPSNTNSTLASLTTPPTTNGYGACGYYNYGSYDDFTLNVVGVPCDSPTSVVATDITTTTATFTWAAPACAVSFAYILNTTPGAPTGADTPITGTSYTATGLTPGLTYYFHILSYCSATDSSAWNTIPVTTLSNCAVPVTPTVSGVTTTSANYSWSAPSGTSVADYQYTLNTTGIAPTGPGTATTATSYDATGLTPGTTYYFYVRTICTSGDSSAWEEVTVTTPLPCDPPTALVTSGITTTGATISWTTPAGASVGNYLYVLSTSPSIPTPPYSAYFASGTTSGNSYTPTTLGNNTTYYFYIFSLCNDGDSSSWAATSFTTLEPCDSPTAVSAGSIMYNGATITWLSPGGAAISNYQYALDTNPTPPAGAGTAITGNTYVATGINPVTTYYFHIRTMCADGDSSGWTTISFTTPPVCGTPVIITNDLTDMGIHIVWTPVIDIIQYQYVLDNSPLAPSIPGTATTDTEYNMIGLNALSTYYFHLSAVCTGGDSPWETINFTTTPNTTGIQNVNGANGISIDVSPNPAREMVNIAIDGTPSGNAFIRLTDMAGQIIATVPVNGKSAQLNVSLLAQGIYFVQYMDDQNKQTVKLVK